MKSTEFVLNEVEFFLNKLEETKELFPDFDYYLNAFISSARSVLWIMKNEYGKIEGWQEWYDNTDVDSDKKILLSGIVDMRNRSLKKKPLQVKTEFIIGDAINSFNIYDEMMPFAGKKINLTIEQGEKKQASKITDGNTLTFHGTINEIHSVEEFKNKDVLEICQQYCDWLKKIVTTCIDKFG